MPKLTDAELKALAASPAFSLEFSWLYSDEERAALVAEAAGDLDSVWTVERAARLLGVKPATVRQYARQHIIPAQKLGKSWRFYGRDLLEHVRCQSTNVPGAAKIKTIGFASESVSTRLDRALAQLTESSPKNSSSG